MAPPQLILHDFHAMYWERLTGRNYSIDMAQKEMQREHKAKHELELRELFRDMAAKEEQSKRESKLKLEALFAS